VARLEGGQTRSATEAGVTIAGTLLKAGTILLVIESTGTIPAIPLDVVQIHLVIRPVSNSHLMAASGSLVVGILN
jgi:hypothetical protein